ncbi:tripartite tricarboxylate transporter substrate-binding protein [Pseudorhodoferax soli]|uniref:Tripartite-type tricarboxylate transporter receptor subunit TctC n=1 Tax=Pseudorhodoferax soli TaxID=545864 RepID=A0A368X9S5_9BURK|nr:tripartite tricarboxylate transporter substrate-binding protein [Pseudorhodoferax soli]RCW63197.1 tripartite-type tricarboxylate transporter receptor subunit TctC [Pseudorhodoferax soli]
MKSVVAVLVGASMLFGAAGAALASDNYPEKGRTLQLVTPFPPGGATDLLARVLAQKFSEAWGIPAIVDNKAGGDMLIGSQAIANAKRDGYTLGFTTSGFVLNGIARAQRVDPLTDFVPIGLVGRSAQVVAVNASAPYSTYKELEAASSAQPEKFSYASCCPGMHFAAEMLKSATNLRALHVPYKGSTPAVNAILGGETTFIIDTQTAVKPFVESGKLRALMVTSRQRASTMPDVPSLNEAGVPGQFETEVWWGLVFPAGVSPAIVAKANDTLNRILQSPEIRKRMAEMSIEPTASTPSEMARLMRTDFDRYSKLAKDANLSFGN